MKNLDISKSIEANDLGSAVDFPYLGGEFEGIENIPGNNQAVSRVFHHRLKRHVVNTLNAIESNPKNFTSIYDARALAGAYRELINSWDHEPSRENMLEKLSVNEERMLKADLQGLGDIIHGSDDELFGIVDFGIGNLSGLGKKEKARKYATGSQRPTNKKGVFTKLKMASKHIKSGIHDKGVNLKQAAKKVGKAVVKFNPLTIAARASFLVAMKTNMGKIASRVYWGHFSLEEAKRAGITVDYWKAANKGWNNLKKTFVNRLKGDESVLFRAVSQGRAKYRKDKLNGLSGIGLVDPQTIKLVLSILKPILEALNKSFEGKQETADSEPETEIDFESLINSFSSDDSVDGLSGSVAYALLA